MKHLLSCEFNFDTVCVELRFSDGSMISIDTIAVENEVADNMYQRSELDYLIYFCFQLSKQIGDFGFFAKVGKAAYEKNRRV